MPALTALRLALGDAARLQAHCAFRSRDKTQLDNLQHVWRECGVCRAAGQMASGTKGEARMGAEQIGNFLPFPLPRSQTLLGMFCNVGALGCPAVPKAFALSAAGALKPHIPNLQPWCGAVGAGKSPILILLRNSGPRSSWGPVHLCWEHTCPPPLARFPSTSAIFFISSQQCRSCRGLDPCGLLIINFYCCPSADSRVCGTQSFCPQHQGEKCGTALGKENRNPDSSVCTDTS